MPPQWKPVRFAAALAAIRDAMDLNAAELGRLAGISRSQATRWARGVHQPAYPHVRQLGIAVYREHPELAAEMMTAAGYPPVTDEDMAAEPGPLDDLKVGGEWPRRWEGQVAGEEAIPVEIRRRMILEFRRELAEATERRQRPRNEGRATA